MNGIDTSTATPPTVLYVASRERVRSGKGVRKITPREWAARSNGIPMGVTCSRGTYISLGYCWPTEKQALAVARAIVQEESDLEEARYAAIKTRIKAAHTAVLTAFRNLNKPEEFPT